MELAFLYGKNGWILAIFYWVILEYVVLSRKRMFSDWTVQAELLLDVTYNMPSYPPSSFSLSVSSQESQVRSTDLLREQVDKQPSRCRLLFIVMVNRGGEKGQWGPDIGSLQVKYWGTPAFKVLWGKPYTALSWSLLPGVEDSDGWGNGRVRVDCRHGLRISVSHVQSMWQLSVYQWGLYKWWMCPMDESKPKNLALCALSCNRNCTF